MSGPVEIAREHWGAAMPDWIEALADAAAATSQNKVARRLGYTAPVISQVLRNKYPGDLDRIELMTRSALMRATRTCPALGEIQLSECLRHQDEARNPGSPNPLRANMRRACNACPHYRKEGHHG